MPHGEDTEHWDAYRTKLRHLQTKTRPEDRKYGDTEMEMDRLMGSTITANATFSLPVPDSSSQKRGDEEGSRDSPLWGIRFAMRKTHMTM